MIKFVTLLRLPPGKTREEVRDYWFRSHAPLVRRCLPGLERYTISFPVERAGQGPQDCDAIVELCFEDQAAMERDLASAAWQSEERKASSRQVLDMSRTRAFYVQEHVIPLGDA